MPQHCYLLDTLVRYMYFTRYIANWEWMYERLVKFMWLKFVEVDESWPYQVFKKNVTQHR